MQPYLDNRIRFLDGLRALAVVLVIVHHTDRSATDVSTAPLALALGHALLEGAHGVDLFFVLSGYGFAVPTLALCKSLRSSSSAPSICERRPIRRPSPLRQA